jgi:hypothetical protein
MAANNTYPNTTEAPPGDQPTVTCAACVHPWAEHDRIAVRFCAATTAEQHDRGCVCSVSPKS